MSPTRDTRNSSQRGGNWFQNRTPSVASRKFEGNCEELKGHIFYSNGYSQVDRYVKMSKLIAQYAGQTMSQEGLMAKAIISLVSSTVTKPSPPTGYNSDPNNASTVRCTASEKWVWEHKMKTRMIKKEKLEQHKHTMFSLVWGQ